MEQTDSGAGSITETELGFKHNFYDDSSTQKKCFVWLSIRVKDFPARDFVGGVCLCFCKDSPISKQF